MYCYECGEELKDERVTFRTWWKGKQEDIVHLCAPTVEECRLRIGSACVRQYRQVCELAGVTLTPIQPGEEGY